MPYDNRSSRLQDEPQSDLERRRDHGQDPGSTRLSDSADTPFEQRRERRRRRDEQLETRTETFADALDLEPGRVEPVQLDDRGEEIGFVPDDRGRDILGRRFAEARPFVEGDEALVEADPTEGVRTITDPEQRPTIADRARSETAADTPFVETDDLDAEVGPGGVSDVRTRASRRDDIAERARTGLAADDPFAEPGDFGVDVGPRGVEDAGFTERGEQRRAGRQFADQTPLEEVGPDDVRQTDDGFGLREEPQRQIAAIEFERETPLRSVDPQQDVTATDDGFGLAEPAERRVAARRFESELDQFGEGELDPSRDVRPTDDGFGLGRGPAQEVAADRIDEQLPSIDVGPGDIELEETASGRFEASFEEGR